MSPSPKATHDAIWKAQGLCVGGCGSGRDIVCSVCGKPHCARCASKHQHTAREKYLAKVHNGLITGYTREEWDEAEKMLSDYV